MPDLPNSTDWDVLDNLFQRVQALEAIVQQGPKSIGPMQILAMAVVKDSNLLDARSSPGVKFAGGKISFPNEKHLRFVPLIADSREYPYITDHHWITESGVDREDADRGYFVVKAHAMDTGGADRTTNAHNFTAVVIGLDAKAHP